MMSKAKIVVLASGEGTLLQALIDQQENLAYEIALVISDNPKANALNRARDAKIESRLITEDKYSNPQQWHQALIKEISPLDPKLIVLAGFMRILSPAVVDKFKNKILNSHPALLPKYPGLNAVAQALAAGDSETGATMHLVDQGVDTGPIVKQLVVKVLPQDSASSLHQRIKAAEQAALPDLVNSLVTYGYQIVNRRVVINH
jgi:phosphoribosylglycinamide formyltransferase 1